MKAFKLFDLDVMGMTWKEEYYLSPKKAEKEFYNRVRDTLKTLPIADSEDLDGSKPWKITTKDAINEKVKLNFMYSYWHEYHTDCGTEGDITHAQVILEEITISE